MASDKSPPMEVEEELLEWNYAARVFLTSDRRPKLGGVPA